MVMHSMMRMVVVLLLLLVLLLMMMVAVKHHRCIKLTPLLIVALTPLGPSPPRTVPLPMKKSTRTGRSWLCSSGQPTNEFGGKRLCSRAK